MIVTTQVKNREADRAIGLLPWCVRFWGKLRHKERAEWTESKAGKWDTAIAGSSALRVALMRAFKDEMVDNALLKEHQHASLLWDVASFYDSLSWDLILDNALSLDFPATYLALEMQIHMACRVLRDGGCFSQAICPELSMIPGSSGAVDLGRCALYYICEKITWGNPLPSLQTWVDDIVQRFSCMQSRLVDILFKAGKDLVMGCREAKLQIASKSCIIFCPTNSLSRT